MLEEDKNKGRMIFDVAFNEDIAGGKLDKLFEYLKENKDKYILAIRLNAFTLYSHGRKVIIKRNVKEYTIEFEMNNANLLVLREPNKLDSIVEILSKLNFDTSKYKNWKVIRTLYLNMDEKEKNKNYKPRLNMKARIPAECIETYDFKLLLDTIYPIFRSYRLARSEENYKQSCISFYNSFQRDLVVFDSEYKPAFKNDDEEKRYKTLCTPNKSGLRQFFKPDLIALAKENDNYKIIFIELKININAAIGETANIADHIIDWQNYKQLYTQSEYEKYNFKSSVIYMLKFYIEHGLIECDDLDAVIAKIDFDTPPIIKIVCGLNEETETQFIKKAQRFFQNKCAHDWEKWDAEIVVGNATPELLEMKGVPLNTYLCKGISQNHYTLSPIKMDILEIAPIILDDEYDEEAQKRLQKELDELSKRRLQMPLTIIEKIAKKIDELEQPIIYKGLMADSLIAYILGYTSKNPIIEKKKFSPFKGDTAEFLVSKDIMKDILDHLSSLYGADISITEIEEGYRIMYYGYKIKIDILKEK